MSRLPLPTVQSRSDHRDIELGRQSPPEYSAVYPDIYSSASLPPPSSSSSSFPFLLPGLLSITFIIFLTI
ncbi:hypothetical protein L211DRAFT_285752 [Terfezia boudieri ATCC MYA-4762]|uniref:Uncharacterized protein n=1 Tax=Terfezia boudieri ATCC MYA-4762 TaxID=1051890 RepID=A0A3N4LNU6_9PEZI|nr:hypothetical protein L211DRAFT_285752 [Terfezia boudieri ATCC MYA-4762]